MKPSQRLCLASCARPWLTIRSNGIFCPYFQMARTPLSPFLRARRCNSNLDCSTRNLNVFKVVDNSANWAQKSYRKFDRLDRPSWDRFAYFQRNSLFSCSMCLAFLFELAFIRCPSSRKLDLTSHKFAQISLWKLQ